MIRRPPRSTLSSSSAASDVYKRQPPHRIVRDEQSKNGRCQISKRQTVNVIRMKGCPECRSLTRSTPQVDPSTCQLCVLLKEWQSKTKPPDVVRSRCEERIKHTCAPISYTHLTL